MLKLNEQLRLFFFFFFFLKKTFAVYMSSMLKGHTKGTDKPKNCKSTTVNHLLPLSFDKCHNIKQNFFSSSLNPFTPRGGLLKC